MLDTDTKRRIDTARDILVGKVPDPKSQVEQITIALIYKFMDDMDAEAEELGGKRNFFTGDFARYGWAKLMHAGLGGYETLNLYAEGIAKMPENPGVPPLFRDIFKNAYLPYRDPETLKSFLKVIDEFTYDHSERLGDAFEYLLSVLGSQGDAGQFRTPRHFIDFIVDVVDPKKTETMIDVACGTAGFIISTYKHILRANTDAEGQLLLTPDERGQITKNLRGYDISPDMVRLSLVNLYLHGFADPHIYEYDTLTSEERWNEYADIFLANPPFMSPKGGIKPHRRFSIQAKRSEVLFVDYIASHLTPTGRAGIIVPEGIIFQSQTAYKALRKTLVEEYLVAVISLPAGVFNPYSGVKTSILILDKLLAKQSDTIAFFKIENDGFGLGAQRRPIEKNDLPQVKAELTTYLQALYNQQSTSDLKPTLGLVVAKDKIAANGDYNLSGERYREGITRQTRYPVVELGEVAEVVSGQSPPGESYNETGEGVPFYQGKTEFGKIFIEASTTWTTSPQRFAEAGDILMSVRAPVGPVNLATQRVCIGRGLAAIKPSAGRLNNLYTFYFLRSQEGNIKGDAGAAFASINRREIEKLKIPIPPLEVQKEIVAEIEGYQKVIDGARAVLDNYRPHIPIHPDWPMVPVGDLVEFVSGLTVSIPEVESEDGIPIIAINNVTDDGKLTLKGLRKIAPPKKTLNYVERGDLLFNWRNGSKHLVGKTALFDMEGKYLFASFLLGIRPYRELLNSRYLWYTLNIYRREGRYMQLMRQNVNGLFNREELKVTEIPLPPLETQQKIVAEIEAEQALVSANRELIERFEKKIQATIARVWGEDDKTTVED